MALDDLVDTIELYRSRPASMHVYSAPYTVLYAAWTYAWLFVFDGADGKNGEMAVVGYLALVVAHALLLLCCHWFVALSALLTCAKVADPSTANWALVRPTANNGSAEFVPVRRATDVDSSLRYYIEFQKVVYNVEVCDDTKRVLYRSIEFPVCESLAFYNSGRGIESEDALRLARRKYGSNRMEMYIPSFQELFLERATAPFFVFQVFTVALWCLDEMWYYSLFTLLMLVVFEATLVKQQMRNMAEIRNMGNKPATINVYRNKRWTKISTEDLIPGDLASVSRSKDDTNVPCDMLLLRGSCIVEESMLTGESVPQVKEPLEGLSMEELSRRHFDIDTDGRLRLIFGGTKVVQHTPPAKQGAGVKSPDNGCICYVLRTGFNTAQGRLLRTIMFGVKRVTANNLETFCFILFLLIFAVAASGYVWVKGTEDPRRSRYKLLLECTLILTSVVPPELPIELSLAVNNSLLTLSKLGVYCTEPFRIPLAGKVDVCCFDKTGTLTTDNLVVEGVAQCLDGPDAACEVHRLSEAPAAATRVLVSCHSLACLDDRELVGDPLEKACLKAAGWTLTKNDALMPPKSSPKSTVPIKIVHRHHFSSALRRMCVIGACQRTEGSGIKVEHFCAVKGAPETIAAMLRLVPDNYSCTYELLSRRGARVLALAHKQLGELTSSDIRHMSRESLESGLDFAGFAVVGCPLKSDSKMVIKEIVDASHKVVMITGDNSLTACHVAKSLRFTTSQHTLIIDSDDGVWRSVDGTLELHCDDVFGRPDSAKRFLDKYDLCVTGPGLTYLMDNWRPLLRRILLRVRVFARMAPKQKECIITELRAAGEVTLMCGDGTNDVGALKHAHVGVALLSHPAPSQQGDKSAGGDAAATAEQQAVMPVKLGGGGGPSRAEQMREQLRRLDQAQGGRAGQAQGQMHNAAKARMEKMITEMEAEERAQIVRLGDASIAAPFTSKFSSIVSICDVIKQGRCTLVTTLQMFKILALNALILAYSQSVLYLDGIKFSDTQATLQGLLLAGCFLFISWSKPLKVLSRQRPLSNVFNVYTIATVTTQFAVHLFCLVHLTQQAHLASSQNPHIDATAYKEYRLAQGLNMTESAMNATLGLNDTTPPVMDDNGTLVANGTEWKDVLDEKFRPTILNTVVYIISMATQVATFAVNYRGRPFMEGLTENRPLLYTVLASVGWVALLVCAGDNKELCTQFELVPLPHDLRRTVLTMLAIDATACLIIDRVLNFVFGDVRPPRLHRS